MIGPYESDIKDLVYFKVQKSTRFSSFQFPFVGYPASQILDIGRDFTTSLGLLIPKNGATLSETDFISDTSLNVNKFDQGSTFSFSAVIKIILNAMPFSQE